MHLNPGRHRSSPFPYFPCPYLPTYLLTYLPTYPFTLRRPKSARRALDTYSTQLLLTGCNQYLLHPNGSRLVTLIIILYIQPSAPFSSSPNPLHSLISSCVHTQSPSTLYLQLSLTPPAHVDRKSSSTNNIVTSSPHHPHLTHPRRLPLLTRRHLPSPPPPRQVLANNVRLALLATSLRGAYIVLPVWNTALHSFVASLRGPRPPRVARPLRRARPPSARVHPFGCLSGAHW